VESSRSYPPIAAVADEDPVAVPFAPEQATALPLARVQYRRLYRSIGVTDGVSVAAAFLLSHIIWFGTGTLRDLGVLTVGVPLGIVAVFGTFRLYEVHRFTTAEEFRRVVLALSLGMTATVALAFLSKAELSRGWILLAWGLALMFTLASRRLWHRHVRRARSEGRFTFRTLIVGTNEEALELANTMNRENVGFAPLGFVQTALGSWNGYRPPAIGHIRNIRDLIRRESADCVFVTSSATSTEEMKHVAKAVRLERVEVRVTATLPQVLASRLTVQPVGGFMSLALRPVRLSRPQAVAKRAFDLAVASVGLVLMIPVWLVVAAAIRLDSSGPVLYRQRRVGQAGRPFVMLKFRTMHVGSDEKVDDLRRLNGVDGLMFKLREDPRVTRVGRRLRRWSLDELPQLWNVVRGDMSVVGPRPPLPEEVAEYEDWQFDRLEVAPGITGLWQVSGRSDLSFDECVRLDLFYIENWSLTYDLFIVVKTIPILFTHRGAY
jgi:exopolysaccharide biosynthesis polyprenyl glycosylphosphotransferase